MGRHPGWMVTLTGRPAMRRRVDPRSDAMWSGFLVEDRRRLDQRGCDDSDVSGPVGSRWLCERGGMPSIALDAPTGRYLSFAERDEIALLKAQDVAAREIARRLGRSPDDLERTASQRRNPRWQVGLRGTTAQWKAELMARRPKESKLTSNERLRDYGQDRLAGMIARPDGELVQGPRVRFIGRRHGHRTDRRWAKSWSPERSPTVSRPTSRMMSPCGSAMRRSTGRSTSRGGEHWSESSSPA